MYHKLVQVTHGQRSRNLAGLDLAINTTQTRRMGFDIGINFDILLLYFLNSYHASTSLKIKCLIVCFERMRDVMQLANTYFTT